MPGRHERRKTQGPAAAQGAEPAPVDHEAQVNQHKHEPHPASHQAARDGARAAGNGERQTARDGSQAAGTEQHAARRTDGQAAPGQAIRDMMGGPQPQGDVPDAPATQIAAADTEGDQPARVRYVANAVPGKPDGEVDTRS